MASPYGSFLSIGIGVIRCWRYLFWLPFSGVSVSSTSACRGACGLPKISRHEAKTCLCFVPTSVRLGGVGKVMDWIRKSQKVEPGSSDAGIAMGDGCLWMIFGMDGASSDSSSESLSYRIEVSRARSSGMVLASESLSAAVSSSESLSNGLRFVVRARSSGRLASESVSESNSSVRGASLELVEPSESQ